MTTTIMYTIITITTTIHFSKKRTLRYQMRPKLIPALSNIKKAVCGEAHTLCLNHSGEVNEMDN